MPKVLALVLFLIAPFAAAQTFIISDIRVEGLQRVSAGTVFAALPFAVGDAVDERDDQGRHAQFVCHREFR